MGLDYAAMTTLIVERLQSSGTADYTTAEVDNALRYALSEYSYYYPHLVGVNFTLEGRKGTATETSADNLIDTTNGQFVAGDATDEKVIHNTTDYTWAVVLSQASTAQIGLSADIMAVNENYKVYNKQCTNHRQIYIGDMPNYDQVHSVEYPIGQRRRWTRFDRILELDIDYVPNTNSNTTKVNSLANDDVLVRFRLPHTLPNLTDFAGKMAATAAAAATSISSTSWQGAGTLNVGTEFTIENHRTTYIVASSATIASSAATISLYPPLEAKVSSTDWTIAVRQSSLDPQYEDLVAEIAACRCQVTRSSEFLTDMVLSGGRTYQNFLQDSQFRLNDALGRLRKSVPPKTSRRYPSD